MHLVKLQKVVRCQPHQKAGVNLHDYKPPCLPTPGKGHTDKRKPYIFRLSKRRINQQSKMHECMAQDEPHGFVNFNLDKVIYKTLKITISRVTECNAVMAPRCSHVEECSLDQNIKKIERQTPNKLPLRTETPWVSCLIYFPF